MYENLRKPFRRRFAIDAFYTAYDYNWNSTYRNEGEVHDFWEIVYVASGAVGIAEDDRVYQVVEGNMILHAPMEFHNICSAEGTRPHVVIVTFSATGELPSNLREGSFLLTDEQRTAFESIFKDIKQYVDNPKTNCDFAEEGANQLAAFLLRLSRTCCSESAFLLSPSATEYTRLVEEMNTAVCDNLSLEDLAQKRHISISYIKQLFKRYAGISPKSYYSRLRCTEAIRRLRNGTPVAEVAEAMHFSSPSYFSAFFKKMTGQPPAQYVRGPQNDQTDTHP